MGSREQYKDNGRGKSEVEEGQSEEVWGELTGRRGEDRVVKGEKMEGRS